MPSRVISILALAPTKIAPLREPHDRATTCFHFECCCFLFAIRTCKQRQGVSIDASHLDNEAVVAVAERIEHLLIDFVRDHADRSIGEHGVHSRRMRGAQ
jgi:hypothetical protein